MTKQQARATIRAKRERIATIRKEMRDNCHEMRIMLAPWYTLRRQNRDYRTEVAVLQREIVSIRQQAAQAPAPTAKVADVLGDQPRCHHCHRKIRRRYWERKEGVGITRQVLCMTCHAVHQKDWRTYIPHKFRSKHNA